MMRLTTMLRVDQTVDGEGRSPLAEQILTSWEHDRGTARSFRSSSNFLYTFERAGAPHFLRFAAGSERRRGDVAAEIDVVQALAAMGIDVASPVPSTDGRLVETVTTRWGTFHAVFFTALVGSALDLEDLDAARFREWGAELGRLHEAMAQLPRELVERRRSWRDDVAFAAACLPDDATAARQELAVISTALEALQTTADSDGLIHFDFELDNIVWRNGGIGVLDFDDCARYPYAADIVFALRDLFDGPFDADHPSFREFVRGYAAVRDPGHELLTAAPVFFRLGEALRHAGLRRSMDLAAETPRPDWMTALEAKLNDRVRAYEATLAGPS